VTKEKRLQKLEEETGFTSENGEDLITITCISFTERRGDETTTKKETYTPEEFQRHFPDWDREKQSIYLNWRVPPVMNKKTEKGENE